MEFYPTTSKQGRLLWSILTLALLTTLPPFVATAVEKQAASGPAPTPVPANNEAPDFLVSPVTVNKTLRLELNVYNYNQSAEQAELDAKQFADVFQPILVDDVLAKLVHSVDSRSRLPLKAFAEKGIKAAFDASQLAVLIEIPPQLRKNNVLDYAFMAPDNSDVIKPDTFSGYSNISVAKTFNTENFGEPKDQNEVRPLEVQLENVQNIHQWVLESRFKYLEFNKIPWTRNRTTLSRDFHAYSTRFSAGDVFLPFAGFQTGLNLGGLQYSKIRSIDPFAIVTPTTRETFYLDSDAKVEIYLNGHLFRTLFLPAGTHELRSLPMDTGLNDIQLRVTDNVGRTQVVNLAFVSDFDLLDSGISDFSYGAGYQTTSSHGELRYQEKKAAASAYHKVGLTKWLTTGLNVQGDDTHTVSGGQLIFGTPVGILGLDAAYSDFQHGGRDWAGRVRYRSIFGHSLVFRTEYEVLGTHFVQFGQPFARPFYDKVFESSLGWSFARGMSLGLSTQHNLNRLNQGDRISNSANFTWYLLNNLGLSLQYTDTKDPLNGNDRVFYASLQWFDADFDHQIVSSYSSINEEKLFDYNYNPSREVFKPLANAGYKQNDFVKNYHMEAGYVGQRGMLQVQQSYEDFDLDVREPHRQRTKALLNTGIAYTGHAIALTRPIHDSFALVETQKALAQQVVDINPSGDRVVGVADSWGPGVMPELTGYFPTLVDLQTRDPLASSLITQNGFHLYPTYRSGTTIKLGDDPTVAVSGKLQSKTYKAEKINYQTGTLTATDGAAKYEFFTNQTGEFYLQSVRPGGYVLKLDQLETTLVITVPEKAFGEVQLGNLSFEPKGAVK